MELVERPWHVLSVFILLISGGIVSLKLRKSFHVPVRRAMLLYAWHTAWCLSYLWYSLYNVADATGYYDAAKNGNYSFAPGTDFVNFLTGILVDYLDLSYLGAFLAFNIFGTIGLLAFDGSMHIATENKKRKWRQLAALIVFLPSVSFWSSAIGKDAISFMATCLALWASLDLGRRYRLMIFAVVAMFLVRPHMAGLMVFGLVLSIMLQSKASIIKKIFFVGASLGAAAALTPFALQYAGVADASVAGVTEYMEQREGYNMDGGGAVDISSMSVPVRVATYLFRPFPHEARSIPQLAASADNLILIFVFVAGLVGIFVRRSVRQLDLNYFALTYSALALFVLAMTTANLGIAVRQKWMFVPVLLFFWVSVIGSGQRQPARMRRATLR